MNLAAALFCAVTTVLSVQAITVSVDRADVRPVTVPSEPYVNGWRPLTGSSSRYESLGVDRSLAPLHPVLGKLQEHLQAASEQPKPQRRSKPAVAQYQAVIEYSPAGVPTGFVFTSKPRSEDPKSLSTEREYAFLVPPPREMLRFELEPLKKPPLRESEPYVRSSQYMPQAIKPDPRSPTYYIKPASFAAPVHPFSQVRPFVEQYNVPQQQQQQQQQQTAFQALPNKNPAKQFDSLKSSNDKPYYQTSHLESSKLNPQQHYERFPLQHPAAQQQQQQQHRVINGNYYNQISHPGHFKQQSYERDPSFLVHESHEISYVTPSYKFRPATYHFDSPTQEVYSTSTQPPATRPESSKYTQAPSSVTRPDSFKQYHSTSTAKDVEKQRQQQQQLQHNNPSNTFYVHDFQKTRYTPDINEVLPKVNQPVKFSQLGTTPPPYHLEAHTPGHKVVYVRPELQQQQQQQQQQYPGSIIPLSINQRPADVEYETPESISLKHFNEQQFLLQQQLIQQDRQRLREQEKRRQQELLRQQQEELHKRQQEIKLLELKQKEKQRLEQTPQPELPPPTKPSYSQPFSEPEPQKITPKEQYKYTIQPQLELTPSQPSSEPPFQPIKQESLPYQQVTVQKFEEVVTPSISQTTTQEDFQPVVRPYRPQKPLREQIRRRKPSSSPNYEASLPTESPTAYSPDAASAELTDVPIQTTAQPETTTTPLPTERPYRSRRPGGPLRRRRPSSTTSTTDTSASQEYDDELVKYNAPEIQDFEKKKRVRPVSGGFDSSERRPIRKRPIQRGKGYGKEHLDSQSERIKSAEDSFKDISPTENYPAPFLKELYGYSSTTEKSLSVDPPQDVATERVQVEYYETTVASSSEYYEPTRDDREEEYTHKLEDNTAEDHLFTKTEVNHVETTSAQSSPPLTTQSSTPSPTTTTTTTTTANPTTSATIDASSASKAISSSAKPTHRIRPSRYGNATRPRFSIKDYKSRMEYKNRLAQSSSSSSSPATTEASTSSVATSGPKLRGYKNHQPADPNFKEAANRYKHMSHRTSYRASSSTAPATSQQTTEEPSSTDRPSRYTPKKRINASHYYRSRVAAGSSTTPLSQEQHPQSTARPENVFSSAIRKRPGLKSKLQPFLKPAAASAPSESTEMQSAAETGSFASTSSSSAAAATSESATSPSVSEAANELAASPLAEDKPSTETAAAAPIDLSDVTMDELEEQAPVEERPKEEEAAAAAAAAEEGPTSSPSAAEEPTQPAFDLRREEELFARASQSVADLTSSASALYDKPGMFKAVSPAAENRLISAHLKIATDEPTLPIEAFFQDFAKKN